MTTYPKHCERCKADWEARIEEPVQCPRCKSPYWNIPIRERAKSEGAKNQVRTKRKVEAA